MLTFASGRKRERGTGGVTQTGLYWGVSIKKKTTQKNQQNRVTKSGRNSILAAFLGVTRKSRQLGELAGQRGVGGEGRRRGERVTEGLTRRIEEEEEEGG